MEKLPIQSNSKHEEGDGASEAKIIAENSELAKADIQASAAGVLPEELKDYRATHRNAFEKRINPERANSLMEMEASLKNNFNKYITRLNNPYIHVKREGWRNRYSDNLEEFNNLKEVVRALSTIFYEHDESKEGLVKINGVLTGSMGDWIVEKSPWLEILASCNNDDTIFKLKTLFEIPIKSWTSCGIGPNRPGYDEYYYFDWRT